MTQTDSASLSVPNATEVLPPYLRARWDASALPADLPPGLDGRGLVQAAVEEGVAPLLYSVLRGRTGFLPEVGETLRRAYYANAGRNILLFRELEAVLQHLAVSGLPVILLKGAALAHAVYRNPALRPMSDLDILVHREDVPRALRELAAQGYAPSEPERSPGAHTAYENGVTVYRDGALRTPLSVHWSLFDSPYYQRRLSLDWFWQTAQPASVNGTPALILGWEAQLLHLCGHAMLHHGGEEGPRLLWLHDVAEVVARHGAQIDWEQVLDRARALDLVLPVQRVLLRIAGQWQASLPPAVLDRLRALRPSREEARVFAELTAAHRSVGRRFWADLIGLAGWRERLRFAWSNLFPTPAYMRHRYRIRHPALVPLYYPYRWFLGLRSLLPSA